MSLCMFICFIFYKLLFKRFNACNIKFWMLLVWLDVVSQPPVGQYSISGIQTISALCCQILACLKSIIK